MYRVVAGCFRHRSHCTVGTTNISAFVLIGRNGEPAHNVFRLKPMWFS